MGDVFIAKEIPGKQRTFASIACKSHRTARKQQGKNEAFILIIALFGVTLHTKYE